MLWFWRQTWHPGLMPSVSAARTFCFYEEIEFLINRSPNEVLRRSAILMAYRARLEAQQGNLDEARTWLKEARRKVPDLPIYVRVQRMIRPGRSSWWKW